MRRWRTQSAVSPQRPGYATGEYSDDDVARRLNQEVLTCRAAPRCASAPRAYRARTCAAVLRQGRGAGNAEERGHCGLRNLRGSDEHGTGAGNWSSGSRAGTRPGQPGALPQGADLPPEPLSPQHHAGQLGAHLPAHGCAHCATQHSPLRGISSNGGDSRYYVDRLCQQRLAKDEWHQSNLRADWIERKIQDLVTSIRLPADWRDRIRTYLFYDEGTDEIEREKLAIRERLRRARELCHDQG